MKQLLILYKSFYVSYIIIKYEIFVSCILIQIKSVKIFNYTFLK